MKNLFKITYVRIYSLLGILVFSFTSSVTLHGQTVAELQTEIDNIEAGSGLEANGAYSADSSTNYLGQATSLKNADYRLDQELGTERGARELEDRTLQGNIDDEVTARTGADDALQANIDAETTAREGADNKIQNNLNCLSLMKLRRLKILKIYLSCNL